MYKVTMFHTIVHAVSAELEVLECMWTLLFIHQYTI